jgi:hypothetical protein
MLGEPLGPTMATKSSGGFVVSVLSALIFVINTCRFYQKRPNDMVAMQTAINPYKQSVVVELYHLHCDTFAVPASRF